MTHASKKTLLIIDDEKVFCDTIKGYLSGDTLEVVTAQSGAQGLEICSQRNVDIVLLDQKLPDREGHTLARPILERNDQTKIIFVTAFPSFESAVKAMRAGAHDYLSKPFDLDELKLTVENALRTLDLERVEQIQNYAAEKDREESVLVGSSRAISEVKRLVESAAGVDASVLITGETGTGKNLVAKAIHYISPASHAAFISINCAALPENLIEAELFGHEKGAFTGAVTAKKGVFEMAEGGTLLLDEIGEMPVHLQSKLLSAIEDKTVRRLGGTTAKQVNVRILSATSTALEQALGKSFRNDLYYRLGVVRIHLPPLRERRDDIPDLCSSLLKRIAGGRDVTLPDSEIAKLSEYDWPGNVRELRNILERAVFVQKGPVLQPSLLLEKLPGTGGMGTASAPAAFGGITTLRESEKLLIGAGLEQLSGNLTRTAKALGISLSTLKRKVKEYGLK
jgi:DNA-binding NtrC family response regulator